VDNAIQLAREKVKNVLGELIQLHPTPVPEDWLTEYSGVSDIEYLNPDSVKVRFLEYLPQNHRIDYHPVQPSQVVFIGGFYVVKEEKTASCWLVGELGDSGYIDCWSRLETLREAIDAI
jgi:hypothetical protein